MSSLVNANKSVGDSLIAKAAERLSLFEIKDAIHEYHDLLEKRAKLEKRLIQVSGKDFEQEMIVMQRLEQVEQLIEVINDAVSGDEILTLREAAMVGHRLNGETLKEIGDFFSLSANRVNQVLSKAYKKISEAAKKRE